MRSQRDDYMKLEREELYEMVWAEPVARLSKRLGVSDVALAKICRKLEVPRPPRGYWAKTSAGKPVKKPPLKKPSSSEAARPYYVDLSRLSGEKHTLTAKALRDEGTPVPTNVQVASTLVNSHPLVARTRAAFRKIRKHDSTVTGPHEAECL